MNPDFPIAVQVTLIGMGLVFATLLICALIITVLSRAFKPKPEAEEEEEEAAAPMAAAVEEPSVASSDSDEAAAIAVALALASRAPVSAMAYRPAPLASRMPAVEISDDQIVGEVVTVVNIDPGAATWSGYGRVKAAN